jgi:hypothetical protein
MRSSSDGTRLASRDDRNVPETVWRLRDPLASGEELTEFGRVAAPVLAGFSLTETIEILGRQHLGLNDQLTALGLVLAAGLLIFAMQRMLNARAFKASPEERLTWYPDAHDDNDWLLHVRAQQWRDERIARKYDRSSRIAYNLGITALLLALCAALWPTEGFGWDQVVHIAAMAVASAAALYELLLIVNKRLPKKVRKLMVPGQVEIEEAAQTGHLNPGPMPFLDAKTLRKRLYNHSK